MNLERPLASATPSGSGSRGPSPAGELGLRRGRKCLSRKQVVGGGGGTVLLALVAAAAILGQLQTATCRQQDIPRLRSSASQQDHNNNDNDNEPSEQSDKRQPAGLKQYPAEVAAVESDDINNNKSEIIIPTAKQLASSTATATAAAAAAAAANAASEDNMKFPLYMRILATLACLIIFTIGVCGNLLVPLVVIKTKYLRNSTNLFLINLSVADLLVLIVCMPTVLIELHSRPETWLLGEPMCKMSNFVEMLAANGSIFTILAISFERYYAICKPLKAGYKCTRLRATIIICFIWILSTLLTSPILIMAKSSETIYIDGSLVYNCILETDTYWHKMYVFVSMIAFFCLPLIVLMLVYWLIGRRLIRENLATTTTTTAAAATCSNGSTDVVSAHAQAVCNCANHRHPAQHQPANHCQLCMAGRGSVSMCSVKRRVASLKKGASLKSISSSLFSLLQSNQSYHQISQHQPSHSMEPRQLNEKHPQHMETFNTDEHTCEQCTNNKTTSQPTSGSHQFKSIRTADRAAACAEVLTSVGARQKRRTLVASKALSLDHHFIAPLPPPVNGSGIGSGSESKLSQLPAPISQPDCPKDSRCVAVNDIHSEQATPVGGSGPANSQPPGRRLLRAHQSIYRLFHARLMKLTGGNGSAGAKDIRLKSQPNNSTPFAGIRQNSLDSAISYDGDNGLANHHQIIGAHSANEMHTNGCQCPAAAAAVTTTTTTTTTTNGIGLSNDDDIHSSSRAPFIASTTSKQQSQDGVDGALDWPKSRFRAEREPEPGRSRFYWLKRFSVSSSSASMQTNCTNLPSESSQATDSMAGNFQNGLANNSCSTAPVQMSPKPIIHGSFHQGRHLHRPLAGSRKSAHFNISATDNSSPSPPICSSGCESSSSNASTYSSNRTPSPEYMFHEQVSLKGQSQHVVAGGTRSHEVASSKAKGQFVLTKNHSSMVEEVDEEDQNDTNSVSPKSSDPTAQTSNIATELDDGTIHHSPNNDDDRQISTTTTTTTDSTKDKANTPNGSPFISRTAQNNNLDKNHLEGPKSRLPIRKGKSLDHKVRDTQQHPNFHFNLRRANTRCGTQSTVCSLYCAYHQAHNHQNGNHLSELMVVQDLSKKQQMDSRRQVVVMLAFVVACFFLLFFPYRVFTIWLILSTEDQVQSLGMETYYNLTYFSRILIYLHSAINPIAYNLISTKFRRAFMSILLCRGSSTRRHFITEHRFIATSNKSMMQNHDSAVSIDHKKQQLKHFTSN